MSHSQQPFPEKSPGRPGWARKRVAVPAALLIFFVGVGVGSSGDGQDKTGADAKAGPRPTVTVTRTAAQPAEAADTVKDAEPAPDGDTKAAVPNFVGMGLQSAQDKAQAAGFSALTSHDALGRARMQVLDRNWKVCSQNIAAGKAASTGTELDFGAVKLEEDCPAEDQSEPAKAGGTMPDFRGKSVKAARAALDSGTSITVTDASGDDRFILVESNWRVCTQKPAVGAAVSGRPVEFAAVKFGESCP
ncbi:hypothetical protein FNH09_29345 [Streptomyces adustus]|uniref:PASTA domain-containing protein n=1 Tax=Streptomyces adustus TaxID=1609272 RepID=A0A5N8VKF5_9ACTN|nr:hypothetical protein [Streptomyces adustus]MPY35202.1 hypothetical protein [Streptomyces adustus]